MPHSVLEGAPGQGKSTIAQYVCQVYRLKLLNDNESLSKIPEYHKSDTSARLPVKIDLRDFATWLRKEDPFGTDDSKGVPTGWRKSLESFIAALISFQSGGASFTIDDLIAVIKVSSVMIVFDGLDEVADIVRRQEVVEEIVKGIQRLEANAASLQTIVTSRPAAFANSRGMPSDKFPYLHLVSLTRSQINEYAERWLRARNVEPREAAVFKKALKEKLDQPHLRDLARNPMQLAILLSLILTRGTSLPDKRTALYDSYIDLFLSRESEKSRVVREHRELLVDIHRYLAWLLHSEAERGNSRGSISQDRLQQTLATYLASEGQDARLASELFAGMVERVVALVSRVEGTFEFEVQPLREYFAARYLYDTAPYSPPGQERRGTKPDRFDALARNFYWTNVTRFYAGCFSKGELPALVERLQVLAVEDGFRYTSQPRMLAATLLSDWVFTQNPNSVKQVVALLVDGIGLRYLLASGTHRPRRGGVWNALALPPRCGREDIVNTCFEILRGHPPSDYAAELIQLAKANATEDELLELWCSNYGKSLDRYRDWLNYGLQLGVLFRIDATRLIGLLRDAKVSGLPIGTLYRARRLDILEASEETFQNAIGAILERQTLAQPQMQVESALDALAHALDPHRYALAFTERAPVPLSRIINQRGRPTSLRWGGEVVTNTEAYSGHKACVTFASLAEEECEKSAAEWATDIDPWDRLVEAGRASWGERWAFDYLANLAAGIRSNTQKCTKFSNLLDDTQSLCKRTRHARLRSGQGAWWRDQFALAQSPTHRRFVCLIALTWARPATLTAIVAELDAQLRSLDESSWYRVALAVRRSLSILRLRKEERTAVFDAGQLPSSISTRTVAALMIRADSATMRALYERYFHDIPLAADEFVLEQIQAEALDLERIDSKDWTPDLKRVKECYSAGTLEPHIPFAKLKGQEAVLPMAIAQAVADEPTSFPSVLVGLAEETCRREVARNAIPVAETAERQGWFGHPVKQSLFD